MKQIRDYAKFAVWFAGFGYLTSWLIAAPDFAAERFGIAWFCQGGSMGPLGPQCGSAQAPTLPLVVHVLGIMCAAIVATRLLSHILKRSRRTRANPAIDISAFLRPSPEPCPPARRPPRRPLRKAHPRAEFGLRGLPR